MAIKRCLVCEVSWEEGQPEKHVMTCIVRGITLYPGPEDNLCNHKWDFATDKCFKCGATWNEVFDI